MLPALEAQLERFRAMSPDEKFRLAHSLWEQARAATAAGVRMRHPHYTEEQVAIEVRELMRDAGA